MCVRISKNKQGRSSDQHNSPDPGKCLVFTRPNNTHCMHDKARLVLGCNCDAARAGPAALCPQPASDWSSDLRHRNPSAARNQLMPCIWTNDWPSAAAAALSQAAARSLYLSFHPRIPP